MDGVNTDLMRGNTRRFRKLRARTEWAFRRGPGVDLPIGCNIDQERLGFEITLMMNGNSKGVLQDQIRFAKASFDVALSPAEPIKYVGNVFDENILRRAIVN
jgi:hypothetical protein